MNYSREQALGKIRDFLAANRREDETTCQTVGRLGIFCQGYSQWDDQQLRELYPWLAEKVSPTRASATALIEAAR